MSQANILQGNYGTIERTRTKSRKPANNVNDDVYILNVIERLKSDLDTATNNLNWATDPLMIDSFNYEISALHKKYEYYLKLCKEKQIICSCF